MDTPATEPAASARGSNNRRSACSAESSPWRSSLRSPVGGLPNNWYAIFKTIHVSVAVVWVGGGVLLTILGIRAQRENDPRAIVTVARQAAFVGEKIFAPAGLVVFLMGVAMMLNTNLGWGQFWVIVGLLGYVSTFTVGIGVLSPLAKRIGESAESNGPEHPATLALIDRILLIARIDVAVLLVVVPTWSRSRSRSDDNSTRCGGQVLTRDARGLGAAVDAELREERVDVVFHRRL